MKVYNVTMDVNHYQSFLPEDDDRAKVGDFDGSSQLETWEPPPVFIYEPKLKAGDFFNFSSDCLIANPRATEALRTLFEMAGELLPLPYKSEIYTILNVTQCLDCIDYEKTKWRRTPDGEIITSTTRQFAFRPARVSESPIFKFPEDCFGVYVVEGLLDPEDEFREIVRREGLKGLVFEEIWSDQE